MQIVRHGIENGFQRMENLPGRIFCLLVLFLAFTALEAKGQEADSTRTEAGEGMHYDLKEVVVKGSVPQITQSGDTAIINPSAYHTPKDAYLKDLVKRVPGLTYDEKDGTISFQGKPIQEILVNGRKFFSQNLKVPVENLPLNLVSRLKVYNRQTDREKMLGIRSTTPYYVLDLQTKKEMNRTFMNSAAIGGGTKGKKLGELNSDYFSNDGENLSFHATGGNQYNTDRYRGSALNSIQMNFTHSFKQNLILMASAGYQRQKTGNEGASYQEEYLQENDRYSLSQYSSRNDNRNVNASINFNWTISKKSSLTLDAGYGFSQSRTSSQNRNALFTRSIDNPDLRNPFPFFDHMADSLKVNDNHAASTSRQKSQDYRISLNYIQRIGSKGTALNLFAEQNGTFNRQSGTDDNTLTLYQSAATPSRIYHRTLNPSKDQNLRTGLTLVQPIGKKLKAQLTYAYSQRRNEDNRLTFSQENTPVDSLSGDNHSLIKEQQIEATLNYSLSDTWQIDLGGRILPGIRQLTGEVYHQPVDTLAHLTNYNGSLRIERTKEKSQFSFTYNIDGTQPELSSLIPLADHTNPLYITKGNPDLKPSWRHAWSLAFNKYASGISLQANASLTQHAMSQATIYDAQTGIRTSLPMNVEGNWNGGVYGNWWKTFGMFQVATNANVNFTRSASLIDETGEGLQQNIIRSLYTNLALRGGFSPSWGSFMLSEMYSFNRSVNSLRKLSDHTHSLMTAFNAFANLPFGLQLQTDFTHTYRSGDNLSSSDRHQFRWNFSATYRFLKGRKMELTLAWKDILNKANIYYRSSSANGFSSNYTPQLRSYLLCTLRYRFQVVK